MQAPEAGPGPGRPLPPAPLPQALLPPTLVRAAGVVLALWAGFGLAQASPGGDGPAASLAPVDGQAEGFEFDQRAARHLLQRAGFGANREQVRLAAEQGLAATLDALFEPRGIRPPPFEPQNWLEGGALGRERTGEAGAGADSADDGPQVSDESLAEARRREIQMARAQDRRQLEAYTRRWLSKMVLAEDPLRDNLTLFWHGHFTSSMSSVRNGHALIRQHETLRALALSDFRTLLGAVLRDPAMLVYLDNVRNARRSPNENLARELFELFTLGEGNYSEQDVREAARALTGHAAFRGEYRFVPGRHDGGLKTILGERARFDAEGLVDLILRQPACVRHLARRLLEWFEGVEPPEERVERYADLLRSVDYAFEPFLRTLFSDPEFYGERVVGARIAGPVEWLVGHVRRLEVQPPERFLEHGTRVLGQHLFHPPSVQGWEGGEAWISTSTLMQRGNLAGVLVGAVGLAEVLGLDGDGGMDPARPMGGARLPRARLAELAGRDEGLRGLGRLEQARQRHLKNFSRALRASGAAEDESVVVFLCAELLAIDPPADTIEELTRFLRESREEFSIPADRIASWGQDGEALLRRLAHRILALPEAQLH